MLNNIKETIKFRNLLWALVSRHLNARYRGSVLGFFWSFLNPLCLILVYSLVFKYYIRLDQVENYTVFLFVGLLPWIWFSSGLLEATSSISAGGSLITKALFPPHILPVVTCLTSFANFLFALPLLLIFMLISGSPLTWTLVFFPFVVFLQLVFLIGVSLFCAALNVYYRDVQHILGNLLNLWFFLTPIVYPLKNIPEEFRFTLLLNPLGVLVEMYHQIFLQNSVPPLHFWLIASGFAMLSFVVGNLVFNRYRENFAELV